MSGSNKRSRIARIKKASDHQVGHDSSSGARPHGTEQTPKKASAHQQMRKSYDNVKMKQISSQNAGGASQGSDSLDSS